MLMPHANKRNFLPKKKTRDELWISLLLVANFHEAALASQSDDGTPLYQCWENWSHHFVLVLSLASLLSQCGQTTIDNTVIPLHTYRKEHGFTVCGVRLRDPAYMPCTRYSDRLLWAETHVFFSTFSFFFFFSNPQLLTLSTVNSVYVYCLWSHKLYFLAIFLLKIGLITLFTHLKIISL